MSGRPGSSHRRDVVHPRRLDTLAVLVAGREPCVTLAHEDAARQGGRRFQVLAPDEVARFAFPPSWAMAVILCPSDDTAAVSRWAAASKAHPGRFAFFLHPDTDARAALAAWDAKGLPVLNAWPARTWRDLSRVFGAHLNSVAHDDFCPEERCRFREMRA
jgi:hypothetical protein